MLVLAASASAELDFTGQSAQEHGLAIATEFKARNQGWHNSESTLTMTLRNANGEENIRKIRIKTLEVEGDGDKSLTIFDQPRDIKGAAFLTFSHVSGSDDQWLYLPALARVKRISSRNKSGPFMASQFAYEDLSSFEIEKYTYRYLGMETIDERDCYKVELVLLDELSGYTRQVIWIDKEHFRAYKIDYYDRKESLMKTLTFSEYELYLKQYWRAIQANMVNHQTQKSTLLHTDKIAFRTGLIESDFNKTSLKRAH